MLEAGVDLGERDERGLVGLEHLLYAGNHGLEIEGPAGSGIRRSLAEDFESSLPEVDRRVEIALEID